MRCNSDFFLNEITLEIFKYCVLPFNGTRVEFLSVKKKCLVLNARKGFPKTKIISDILKI